MSVVVIGLQHKHAPLALLEAVAIGDADLHKVLTALSHRRNLQETVVLEDDSATMIDLVGKRNDCSHDTAGKFVVQPHRHQRLPGRLQELDLLAWDGVFFANR